MSNPPDGAEPLEQVLSLLEYLANELAIARRLVDQGRRIELSGLEDQVGLLCAKPLDLPPAIGRTVRPVLRALRDQVDAVAAILPTASP